MTKHYTDGPRLLADIGGTNARFALELAPGQIDAIRTLGCADFARFEDAAASYLREHGGAAVRHAIIAIANPVNGDAIKMTNHHWAFSIAAARRELGLATLQVVNDFEALAMALPTLQGEELVQVGGGKARPRSVIGLVGAGTGLGVAGLVPAAGRWVPLQSEGGHVALSPMDQREVGILQYCWRRYEHVSAERLVSGPGLSLIHEALLYQHGRWEEQPYGPAQIVERGLAGDDALCREALEVFCALLGTVAGNLAVTLAAKGGIYIGGGVVPRLGEYFARSPFRERFENKGRFRDFNAQIPTLVITSAYPALSGAAAMLSDHLADCLDAAPVLERAAGGPANLADIGNSLETEN
jgi:glucokinase